MRVNARKALTAWERGKAWTGARSIWTNGDSIYSYGTELVARYNGVTHLNVTRYSPTTSTHQNALAAALPDAVRVDGVPMGGYLREDVWADPAPVGGR